MRKLMTEELHRLSVEAYYQAEKLPVVMVLDNIRSLHNVGSVFRTADAFRLAGIRLCGITACPPAAEIHKTALGAEDAVSWKYHADTLEAVRELKAEATPCWPWSRWRAATCWIASALTPPGATPW